LRLRRTAISTPGNNPYTSAYQRLTPRAASNSSRRAVPATRAIRFSPGNSQGSRAVLPKESAPASAGSRMRWKRYAGTSRREAASHPSRAMK